MKKVLIFAVLIALTVGATAQWSKQAPGFFKYTGQAADTANGSNVKNISLMGVPQGKPYFINEYNGSATGWAILFGSLDGTNYHLVDTLTTVPTSGVEGLSADGTVIYTDFSTGLAWPYLRVQLKLSTTGRWNFDYVHANIVGKND